MPLIALIALPVGLVSLWIWFLKRNPQLTDHSADEAGDNYAP